MSLLVFGRSGQVATELARRAPGALFLSRAEADLADPAACAAAIDRAVARGRAGPGAGHRVTGPGDAGPGDAGVTAVINAAAWTAVDAAETDEAAATVVNADAPAAMARACAGHGLPFLHVSTDYVFDGSGTRPWRPDDPVAPLGAYGRSKLAGEAGVRAAGGVHGILRTSWVFSAHGANFLRTMLRLGAERDRLRVVADQIGGPTWAGDIAAALLTMAAGLARDPARTGIYHFAGAPDVSWAGFARAILAAAGLSATVEEIATADYPTPAARPANSRLACSDLERAFGIPRPDWRVGMARVLDELGTATP